MKELVKNTLDALGPENKFTTDAFKETFRRFDIQFELDLQKTDQKNNICTELKNRNPEVIVAFIKDLTGGYIDFSTVEKSKKFGTTSNLKDEHDKDQTYIQALTKEITD